MKKMDDCAPNGKLPENVKDEKKDEKEEETKEMEKSQTQTQEQEITEEALVKSLDEIEQLTKSEKPRKQALLEKSAAGDASDEEQAELAQLLVGGGATLSKNLSGSLDAEPEGALAKSYEVDVSGALEELVSGLKSALEEVGGQLEKSTDSQTRVNTALAKGILDAGRLTVRTHGMIKSLTGAIEQILAQPVATPRGIIGNASPSSLEKGFSGAPAASDAPSRTEINALMEDMLQKSTNGFAPCGEDLTVAIAKSEQGLGVSPALMRDLAKHRTELKKSAA
jgi:hypothetical protein